MLLLLNLEKNVNLGLMLGILPSFAEYKVRRYNFLYYRKLMVQMVRVQGLNFFLDILCAISNTKKINLCKSKRM